MPTMDPESAQQSESQLSAPPPLSDLDSSSDSSDSEAEDSSKAASKRGPQPVEWLATSRSRRSTAGNRMKSMLANEEPDSDLELLFAEDEDDQGFTDAGDDASDVQMDSSSDDEGDNNAGDELEGEQELERQARERRAAQRKRKAQEAIPAKFRKKVRIHPAASESSTPAPAPRPKKKSERTSWLPSPADLPTRASSRKTTRMSKEQLHQQMIEREERRLKQLEQMQKKAARMEALKKPPMTQEDRLREAAIVEKRNSKSLNRWEVAEKQREEERRAKLAALNQRTLKGPVITFWTGLGEARRVVIEEEKPKRKRVDKKDKDKGKGVEATKDAADAANVTAEKDVKEGITLKEGQQQTDASTKVAADGDNAAAAVPKSDATETQSKDRPASTSAPTPAPAADETKTADAAPPLKQEDDEKIGPLKSTPNAPPSSSSQPPNATVSPISATAPATTAAASSTGPLSPTASSTAKPPGDIQPAQPVVAAPLLSPLLLSHPPLSSGLAAPASASPLSAPPRQTSPLAAPPGVGSPRPIEAGKPSGVLALPVLAPPPVMNMDYRVGPAPKSNILALPNASLPQTALAPPTQIQPPSSTAVAAHVSTEPVLTNTVLRPIIPEPEPVSKSASPGLSEPPPQPAPGPAEAPETTTRNVIIFQNFNENAIQDKSIQTQILFGRKMNKLSSKPLPNVISFSQISLLTSLLFRTRPCSNMRHHRPPSPLQRPKNWSPLPQRRCLP